MAHSVQCDLKSQAEKLNGKRYSHLHHHHHHHHRPIASISSCLISIYFFLIYLFSTNLSYIFAEYPHMRWISLSSLILVFAEVLLAVWYCLAMDILTTGPGRLARNKSETFKDIKKTNIYHINRRWIEKQYGISFLKEYQYDELLLIFL